MEDTYSCIIVKIIINHEKKMLRSVYNITFKGSCVWSLGPHLFDRVSHWELIRPWWFWPNQWVNPLISLYLCGLISRLWESRPYSEEFHWAIDPWECILSQVSLYHSPYFLDAKWYSTFCSSMCQDALPHQSQKWWMKLTISYNLWNWTKLNLFSS